MLFPGEVTIAVLEDDNDLHHWPTKGKSHASPTALLHICVSPIT